MKSQNISQRQIFQNHENNVEESYLQFLSEIREDLEEDEENEQLSEEFQEEFRQLVFSHELNDYHPLKFYWLNLIDKLVDTLALIEEDLYEPSDLIGVFSESDLLGFIVDQLEQKVEIDDIFNQIIDLQELQIIAFYHLHISTKDWQPNGPVSYRLISEIGENRGHLFLGKDALHFDGHDYVNGDFLAIVGFFPDRKELQLLDGDKVVTITGDYNLKIIKDIRLYPGFEDQNNQFGHEGKLQKALETLEVCCPDLYTFFKTYSKNIIPIFEDELVSFSMATLPAYSSINMNNRDLVDMIDDLIHENGHHFLNSLIEGEEDLIFEDDDKIFFSPWRRSLRPIRGLYHAVVTFYWAYRLFKELSLNKKAVDYYTHEEMQKVYWRFLEEAQLIRECKEDLDKAHVLEKVSDFGKKLTDLIFEELEQDHKLETEIKSRLSEDSLAKLEEQLEEVKRARLA